MSRLSLFLLLLGSHLLLSIVVWQLGHLALSTTFLFGIVFLVAIFLSFILKKILFRPMRYASLMAMRFSNQKNALESILTSMAEGVLTTDRKKCIREMNLMVSEIFSLDPHTDYIGRSLDIVLQIPEIVAAADIVLEEKRGFVEREVVLADQNVIRVRATQLVSSDGEIRGVLFVFNDVTRLKELEQMRKSFAANVSHELRTPLTSIQGYVETILDGKVSDPTVFKDFLQIVHNHTIRLRGIIEDLMSLSRIENEFEQGDISKAILDIAPIIKSAISQCEIKAKARNVTIVYYELTSLKAKVNAGLMEQAIYNLLDNAIKFSPVGGEVKVTSRLIQGEVEIMVQDQGFGIKKKYQTRVFERFFMIDKARSRELGGSGLGLAIVKHITMVHQGRVSIQSEAGHGAKFFIYIQSV